MVPGYRTSESVPEAEAFVAKKADLQISVGSDAQPVACATEVFAHRRDKTNPIERTKGRHCRVRILTQRFVNHYQYHSTPSVCR